MLGWMSEEINLWRADEIVTTTSIAVLLTHQVQSPRSLGRRAELLVYYREEVLMAGASKGSCFAAALPGLFTIIRGPSPGGFLVADSV